MIGFGFFDSVFPVLFTVMFVLILGVIIATLVRNVGQWHKNNKSPRLTVQATVVSKRMEVTRHHDANSHMSHSSRSKAATGWSSVSPTATTAISSRATGEASPSRAPDF